MCVYCKLQYTYREVRALMCVVVEMEKKTMDCSPEQEEDQKAKDHKDSARHQNNASVINKIQAQKKLAAEERKAAQEHNAAVREAA